MTKKIIITILTFVLIAIPAFGVLTPTVAHADCLSLTGYDVMDCVYAVSAGISQVIFTAAGGFLSITGVLLNGVMVATLNIKTIVDNTPAIGVAWTTIRDFSSIFIIFMLLWASLSMILGIKGPSLGDLIKNIILAGLLINFSLFGTKLVIDASNIVSLSFYCAMAPQSGTCSGGVTNTSIVDAFSSTGLSNIFMQSLDIQATIPDGTILQGSHVNLSITLAYLGGTVLMVVAGISFITAAVMFALRIGILILLMAFSPIYFISWMFPSDDIKKYAAKWSNALKSLCLFMPVYLFLMYIAVSILNDPHFFDFANTGLFSGHTVGIILQYIIAFIMINAPLLAAISVASEGASVISKMGESVKKWGQGAVQGGLKRSWRETGGRAANALSKNENFRNIAGNTMLGGLALKATRGVAGDYSKSLETKTKEREAFATSLGRDETKMAAEQARVRNLKTTLAQQNQTLAAMKRTAGPTPSAVALYNIANQEAIIGGTKAAITRSERKSVTIDTMRQSLYARRTKGGLFNRLAGNNTASAKVEVSVEEKKMARTKKDLDDNKSDLKKLEGYIKNNRSIGTVGTPGYIAAGSANPAQEIERTSLLSKIATAQAKMASHENRIDQLNIAAK